MSLRRQVRLTVEHGARVRAVVEDVQGGFATVRLAPRGSRLTNIPVSGGTVVVGQTVEIDYSAEGQPYVYATASIDEPTSMEPTPPLVAAETDLPTNTYPICKVTVSAPYEFEVGYSGFTLLTHTVKFDTAIYDPLGMLNVSNGSLNCLETGRYLIRWCAKIGPTPNPATRSLGLRSALLDYGTSTQGARCYRRWNNPNIDGGALVGGVHISTLYSDRYTTPERVFLQLIPHWWNTAGGSVVTKAKVTLLVGPAWPIIEMYKLASIGSGPYAHREVWF